jgi:DnaK suppressor protein
MAMSDSDYMNDAQLDYFRDRLYRMRAELLSRDSVGIDRSAGNAPLADIVDRASAEETQLLSLRLCERNAVYLEEIDYALSRIDSKDYGYCEKTGESIGLKRLIARPTTTVCVHVKTHDEKIDAHFKKRRLR